MNQLCERRLTQVAAEMLQGVQIDFPITRQDIAEMTSTTLYTVSRTLSACCPRRPCTTPNSTRAPGRSEVTPSVVPRLTAWVLP